MSVQKFSLCFSDFNKVLH